MGSKCNSFDARLLAKTVFSGGHLRFLAIEKMLNIYILAYVGFEINTPKLTRICQKTLYMSKKQRMNL